MARTLRGVIQQRRANRERSTEPVSPTSKQHIWRQWRELSDSAGSTANRLGRDRRRRVGNAWIAGSAQLFKRILVPPRSRHWHIARPDHSLWTSCRRTDRREDHP